MHNTHIIQSIVCYKCIYQSYFHKSIVIKFLVFGFLLAPVVKLLYKYTKVSLTESCSNA